MKIERVQYRGWLEAYRCTVGLVELVVVTSIGPRILSLRLDGGANVLFEDETDFRVGAWRMYGGHRFATAPECAATYTPDNAPCDARITNGRLVITQPLDANVLQKTWTIGPNARTPGFEIVHEVTNRNRRAWHGAPWACTCVKPGGQVVIPWFAGRNRQHQHHASSLSRRLDAQEVPSSSSPDRSRTRSTSWSAGRSMSQEIGTPVGSVSLVTDTKGARYWALAGGNYASPGSPQWGWTRNHFVIKSPLTRGKVGLLSPEGCLALVRPELTFLIRTAGMEPQRNYPHGCNVEVFTSSHYLEMETLGLLTTLGPGQRLTHREQWELVRPALTPSEFLVCQHAPHQQHPSLKPCQAHD